MITRNYFKVVRVFPDPSDYFYIKNEGYESGTLYVDCPDERTDIEFKIDNGSWTNFKQTYSGSPFVQLQPNSKVYFRGTAGYFKNVENEGLWFDSEVNTSITISIGGDLRTLLNYTDVDSVTTIPENCFNNAFSSSNLISIDNLTLGPSVTTIGNHSLEMMFQGSQIQNGLNLSGVTTVGAMGLSQCYCSCHSLTTAYAPNVSTWEQSKTNAWLFDATSTGVIYKPANLTIPTGTSSGVPDGWTTQTYPNA